MEHIRLVIDVLLWIGVALALTTIVMVVAEHARSSVMTGDRWLVPTLAAYALASLPVVSFGFDGSAGNNAYFWRIVPLCVFALPGLLARSVEALCERRSSLHRACDALTLVLLAATIVAPRFPGPSSPDLPAWYYAVVVLFLVQIVISVVASWRSIHHATIGQPRATRVRGIAMIGALVSFSISYAAWVIAPSDPMALATSVTLLLSGILLVASIRTPRTLLGLLARARTPVDEVLDRLVAVDDVREELPVLLDRAAAANGLLGIAVLDAHGQVIELSGSSEVDGAVARATRELRIDSRAGGSTIVAWSTALTPPLRASDRAQLAVLGTLVQMSIDRDALASHERAAAATLVEANALKDRFVALVSHELRTPLTSIIGLARTSYDRWDDLDPQQVREFQRLIAEQGERLAQIVEHLLLVSAIEAGAVTAANAPVDVRSMIITATEDAGVFSAARVDIPAELEQIVADERLLREILVNFLSNADKYAAPPFDVELRRVDTELEFVVRDHGGGVPPSLRDRLFERFTRDPRSERPGSGLGLAIANDLALAMQGSVGHRDGSAGGSEFWLRIPLIESS